MTRSDIKKLAESKGYPVVKGSGMFWVIVDGRGHVLDEDFVRKLPRLIQTKLPTEEANEEIDNGSSGHDGVLGEVRETADPGRQASVDVDASA